LRYSQAEGVCSLQVGLILSLAARFRLPAIYAFRVYAVDGGLMCYGPNSMEPYRRSASYVDRVLKGEIPADMPVQAPTKYELVIGCGSSCCRSLANTMPQRGQSSRSSGVPGGRGEAVSRRG
jgi:putative ABC transport system substrate-binding protein